MKKVFIIFLALAIIATAYAIIARRFHLQPQPQSETTIQDLINQSKANLPGNKGVNIAIPDKSSPSQSVDSPALQSVPADTQSTIRNQGAKAAFTTFVPTNMPENFSLSPSSLGNATENGVEMFGFVFKDAKANTVWVKEYDWKVYLKANSLTANQFFAGTKRLDSGGQSVYLAKSYTINSTTFQYVQGATLVRDNTLINISYYNSTKLSDASLAQLAASFVK